MTFDLSELPPELQEGNIFLANLGSFWSDIYGGQPILEAHFQNQLILYQQAQLDYLQNVAALSRYDVPVFKRKQWQLLTIYLSDRNSAAVDPVEYGNAGLYGAGEIYGAAAPTTRFQYPVKANLADAAQVLDRPLKPRVVQTRGVDFRIDTVGRFVEFLSDPFTNANFTTRSTIQADGTSDQAIDLWLYAADIDWHAIEQQFGYVLSLYLNKSSEYYRDLVNAYWNCLSDGPSLLQIRRGIAAACRLPVVKNTGEIIQTIINHPLRLQVVTNLAVYSYPPNSQLADGLAVGSVLTAGDVLTDALIVLEFGDGAGVDLSAVPALSLGRSFSGLPLQGGLTFRNGIYNTSYSVDSDGFAVVMFTGVDGFPTDVAAFWAAVYSNGKQTGKSVAQALRKVSGVGQPTADQIYTTVNPMLFLVQQMLNTGVIMILVRTEQLGLGAKLRDLFFLRQILPAHTALLFHSETDISVDSYTGSNGNFSEPGVAPCWTSVQVISDAVSVGTGDFTVQDLTPRGNLLEA